MAWPLILVHVVLPLAVAAAAGFGAWRCWRLLQYARDPRLVKLGWFYGLFAASSIAIALWMGQLALVVGDASNDPFAGLHGAFLSEGPVNGFLVAHHVLMLSSLLVATFAFSHVRAENAVVAALGVAAFGLALPAVLGVEAALTLHLAIRAVVNHRRRRTPRAWQVAAGFLLFSLGHLTYFVYYQPGAGRNPLGDIFALVGIVLLVRLLPRPTA